MAGIRPFAIGLGVVLFSILLIYTTTSGIIGGTNPTNPLLIDSVYGINNTTTSITNSLEQFSSTSEQVRADFANSSPSATDFLFLIFKGAFFIPLKVFGLMVSSVVSASNVLLGVTRGLPLVAKIGVNLLFSALLFTAVFLGIKVIRTGESER